MGKRSDFERFPRDYYPTPYAAVVPLLPHLAPGTRFIEPCAGDGRLVDHLEKHGHECVYASDIEPLRDDIRREDAFKITWPTAYVDCFITNSPWDRKILHPLIEHLTDQAPTWLLLDADWAHTKQAAPYMARCRRIVSVGRVKWIEDSKFSGKDNAAWFNFDTPRATPGSLFFARAA